MSAKLERLNAVEEIGRFSKLTHKAEQFAKLSLIFARNGFGKSTICAILRSASDGNASHIKSRRKLGAINDSRVQSTWGLGISVSFSAGKWSGCPGKIYVFDHEFVAKNLHIGDSVTRDNKRSLLPVVLGDQGVKLAEKVSLLDAEQKTIDERRRQSITTIIAGCKGIKATEIESFCKAEMPSDLAEKTTAAAQRLSLIKEAEIVKQKKNPSKIELGGISRAHKLLEKTIDSLSQDAIKQVQDHLTANNLGEKAHAWLLYGTTHALAHSCPYCAQDTSAVPLITAYKAFFSDALKDLKGEVDSLYVDLENLSQKKISDVINANQSEFSYWQRLCEFQKIPALSMDELKTVELGLSKLKLAIEEKRSNPLEPINVSDGSNAILQAIQSLQAYNDDIECCCAVIEQARIETISGNLAQAELTHSKWIAMGERLRDPVKTAVAEYLVAATRLIEIKTEKLAAQESLKTYTDTTMADRQNSVNNFLSDFGANFSIVDVKTSFVGREPNTEFAIEIDKNKLLAGDRSDSEPSFKTVLSSGDKTTLALAFFFAQVSSAPSLNEALIVFDDPFNSQDMERQFQTTSHIRSLSDKACQTIVLSHDPRFLQLIEKNSFGGSTRTFQLQCSDAGEGSLQAWSSADELKSLYVQQSEIIREYATHGALLKNQTLNSIHQAIRPFLEDYLRLRFPGRFPDQAHMFEMAKAIADAGNADPLAQYSTDLLALNEYTRPNMHGGGFVPIASELRAHCRKVVKIVGSY